MEFIVTIQEPEIQVVTVASQGEQGIQGDKGDQGDPGTSVHNDTTGKQGGQAGEFYHLTADEQAGVSASPTTITAANPAASQADIGAGGGAIDYANPVSITGAASIPSINVGKNHVCTGVVADYTLNLPTTGLNVGDLFGFEMSSALTEMVTLDALAGQLIDGQQTRVMWAKEKAVLKWDGTNWQKISGLSIPMTFSAYLSGNQTGLTSGTFNTVELNTISFDNGGVFNTTDHKFRPRRNNVWSMTTIATAAVTASAKVLDRILAYLRDTVTAANKKLFVDINGLFESPGSNMTGAILVEVVTSAEYILYQFAKTSNGATWFISGVAPEAAGTLSGQEVLSW